MGVDEAQPALLLGSQLDRRRDSGAPVLGSDARATPIPVEVCGGANSGGGSGVWGGGGRGWGGPARPPPAGGGGPAPGASAPLPSRGGCAWGRRGAGRRPGGVGGRGGGAFYVPRRGMKVPGETQKSRRRPIFPKGCPLSIFGAGELNFRVRDGNGCGLSARVTGILRVWMVSAAARRTVAMTERGAG